MVLDHLLPHLSQLGRGVCKMRIRSLRFFLFVLDPGSPIRIHNPEAHEALTEKLRLCVFICFYVRHDHNSDGALS